MDEATQAGGAGPSHRGVEIAVAVATALFGAIVILGSLQVGVGWGAEGPKSGFFPFYLGVLIIVASLINLLPALARPRGRVFAEWAQLRQVMSVVIPSIIYVAIIPYIGIYIASVLLIAVFMNRLGRYRWAFAVPLAITVMVATYLTFEKWFLVPLPKGPLEEFLGL